MILNNEQQLKEILDEGVVVIDFFATWCNPCKMLSPIIDTLEGEMSDVKFVKVNIDDYPELAVEYGVATIPNIKIVKSGEVVETLSGFMPKQILEGKINPHRQ